MKRPLCLITIVIAAAVFLYLELFSDNLLSDTSGEIDGGHISICGTVSFREYRKDYIGNVLPVLYLIPDNGEYSGNLKYIQCYMSSSEGYIPSIGEKIKVEGRVKAFMPPTNPGEFNSLLYYSTLKISYRLTGAQVLGASGEMDRVKEYLCRIRFFLERSLDRALEPRDSAMLKAVLLGDRAYMDEELKELYKQCGIIHILSVSGLHISIMGMGIYELLRKIRVNQNLAGLLSIGFIYLYGTMCGMGTSPFRAILMFSLRMLAPMLRRTYDILTALGLAGLLLLISQPLYLYNSGFLFSFGAVIGIAYLRQSLLPVFLEKKWKMHLVTDDEEKRWQKVIYFCTESLISSLAIFIVTLPVYASSYYTYPVYGFMLNLLIIPLMIPFMIVGFICLVLAAISSKLALIPGIVVHVILEGISLSCEAMRGIPGKTWYIGHTDHIKITIYLAIILAYPLISDMVKKRLSGKKKITAQRRLLYEAARYAVLIGAMVILLFSIKAPVTVTALDIGQGDAIVLEVENKTMLIDGGSTSEKQIGKYKLIPFLQYEGIGYIDIAVMTHEDTDHISGLLELMDDMEKGGIAIGNLMLPGIPESLKGDNYHELESRASKLNIPITYICEGKKLVIPGTSAELICLNPDPHISYEGANEYSTVLYMRYGDFSALFTGDVEGAGQENLKENIASAGGEYSGLTLLKVAHHGSEYTTDEEFLNMVRPKIAVISCGKDNSYGHPHRALLERLNSLGAGIYRTDESGAIRIETNGKNCKIIPFVSLGE